MAGAGSTILPIRGQPAFAGQRMRHFWGFACMGPFCCWRCRCRVRSSARLGSLNALGVRVVAWHACGLVELWWWFLVELEMRGLHRRAMAFNGGVSWRSSSVRVTRLGSAGLWCPSFVCLQEALWGGGRVWRIKGGRGALCRVPYRNDGLCRLPTGCAVHGTHGCNGRPLLTPSTLSCTARHCTRCCTTRS